MLLNGTVHNEKHKRKRKHKHKTLTRKFANSKLLRPVHNENVSINTTLTHDINAGFEGRAFTMKSLTRETWLMPSTAEVGEKVYMSSANQLVIHFMF